MAAERATAARERPAGTVVTGVGPIAAGAVGRDEWRAAAARATAPAAPLHDPGAEGFAADPFPLFRPQADRLAAVLAEEKLDDLPPDPELRLGAAAARLAIRDAALGAAELERAALVVSYEAPGMDLLLRGLFADWSRTPPAGGAEALPPAAAFRRFYDRNKEAVYGTHSFLHLHVLARELGIHGPTLFLNNACASGLYALEAGAAFLRDGKAERAVVVAAESPVFPSKHLWFEEAGLAARDGALRPFDAGRSGLVLGEGAAALVLETAAGARARRAPVYAEYAGGASNQEGWKVTTPNFAAPYYEEVIRGACTAAGIQPGDVDAVFAHGAGTALSDAYEARGIVAVFGEWPERPAIVALKGGFGHTLGASALLDAAAAAVALRDGFLPGSAGFSRPDPRLKVRPLAEARPAAVRTILKLANGFAGFNAAAILRRPEGS